MAKFRRQESRRRDFEMIINRYLLRCICFISVTAHGTFFPMRDHSLRIDSPREDRPDLGKQTIRPGVRNLRESDLQHSRLIRDDEAVRDLVVGGTVVTSAAYRSFAVPDPASSNGLCGATLIHSDILISAAHCGVADIFADGTLMNIGSLSIFGEDSIDRIEVVNQLLHPNFNSDTLANDVMLIQLASPSSAPVAQWNVDPSVPADGESLTVVGFGKTESGTASSVLREGTLFVVDTETCDAAYQLAINGEQNICAGSDTSAACSGDSGGPLFRNGVLVGVVSFGIVNNADGSCLTSRDLPNGYTRVSTMSDFISEGICALSANPPVSCLLQLLPPIPVPTKVPTRQPTTQAPVTTSPTQTPQIATLPPASTAPRTPPPLLLALLSSSPTINNFTLPPSARTSLSPSPKTSESPTLGASSSPTMDQTFVPSDFPTFILSNSSTIPTNSPISSAEATDSNEDINITIITLPRPKSDATNSTVAPVPVNQTATSLGATRHIGYNCAIIVIVVLYGIWTVVL